MRKFLSATFLGRAPSVRFFAPLGVLTPVSTQVLVTCAVAAVVAGVVVALHKGPRALLRTGLVAGDGPGTAGPRPVALEIGLTAGAPRVPRLSTGGHHAVRPPWYRNRECAP